MNNILTKVLLGILLSIIIFWAFTFYGEEETVAESKDIPRPNIILIMADDMGYSDIGCYGSEINTPNLDKLASEGIRFTQFYNASVCCPSRASLLTGLFPHQAGVGYMVSDWGHEGYQGHIKHDFYTLAEMFGSAGYATIMSGKWHLGTGEGDNPWERGFNDFYGIPNGGGVYFWPTRLDRNLILYDKSDGLGPVKTQPDPNTFYTTDAFTDYAVRKLEKGKKDDKPFFMYVAYIAPHYPQQAREEVIQKYIGKYKKGWEKLRKERYARQIEMGIISPDYPLSPAPEGVLDWDGLSEAQKTKFDRQMAVYAAQVDILDQNIGKILNALKQNNMAENTMVIFLSDNGAQRNDENGFVKSPDAVFGTKESYGGYAKGWGNLSNTPFKGFKLQEYNGGIATPFIVRWPAALKNKGEINNGQVAHIIDIVPTCLAAAGLNSDGFYLNDKGQELEGINLLPYFKNNKITVDRKIFWEHRGNRAVRDGDWKLVADHKEDWKLYNLAKDRTELHDLSDQFPQKVEQLKVDFGIWAKRTGVLPWPVEKLK